MVGLVPALCRMQKKLQRVGYVTAKALQHQVLADAGDTLLGHEFHFSTLEPLCENFPWAYELAGSRQKEIHKDGYAAKNLVASYLHMNFDGNPGAAEYFLKSCEIFQKSKSGETEVRT